MAQLREKKEEEAQIGLRINVGIGFRNQKRENKKGNKKVTKPKCIRH